MPAHLNAAQQGTHATTIPETHGHPQSSPTCDTEPLLPTSALAFLTNKLELYTESLLSQALSHTLFYEGILMPKQSADHPMQLPCAGTHRGLWQLQPAQSPTTWPVSKASLSP